MKKYILYYWILVAIGIAISLGLSSLAHSFLGIPRGVPLESLGVFGKIGQFSLMVFPFVAAPILSGYSYFLANRGKPTKKEVRRLTAGIAFSIVLLLLFFWIGSGAWFGLFQGTPWVIFLVLMGPPMMVTVSFRVLFPMAIAVFAGRSVQIDTKSSNF